MSINFITEKMNNLNSLQGLYSSGVMNSFAAPAVNNTPVQVNNTESAAAASGSSIADVMNVSSSGSSIALKDKVVNSILGNSSSETGNSGNAAVPFSVSGSYADSDMSSSSLNNYFSCIGFRGGEEGASVMDMYTQQYEEFANVTDFRSLLSCVAGK